VQGNLIGVTASGDGTLGGLRGVLLSGNAHNNTVGTAGGPNLIAANAQEGIRIDGDNNLAQNNQIGFDSNGHARGNRVGIAVGGDHNTIGGARGATSFSPASPTACKSAATAIRFSATTSARARPGLRSAMRVTASPWTTPRTPLSAARVWPATSSATTF
jgi:hypothetical protein